ncbi:hypothetical protein M5D96_006424 [Drosophila gunungcola]|uniref:Laminin N-terminal domain-containing protein n=1 Tax=Drosophila gunungcola TaxID=103775 RepID=A0A9P9YP25_9MUSC|nr:hypothetical protein M5D96_006424 [Drosophila gunungcola]
MWSPLEFHVAYFFIRMVNSPRPGIWTLEKSTDYGKTWTPWQHFSDTPANCETYLEKSGLFFNNQKAYDKLFEHFDVGTEIKISFDFRPRDPNGLLLSVHGKSSYAILELVDNTLFFNVKTDLKNIVTTNYKLPNNEKDAQRPGY